MCSAGAGNSVRWPEHPEIIFLRLQIQESILPGTPETGGCEKIASSHNNSGTSDPEKPASPSGDIFWKRAYVLLCVILLCLTAGQFFIGLSNSYSGMDYRVVVGAVQSVNHGEDPYFLLTLNQYTDDYIPFNYAPHTLLILWCLQFLFIYQSIWIYYAILVAFMVVGGYLIVTLDQKPQYLFFITLLLTGFASIFWNFYNGDKDILFLFLFAGIFHLLVKEKFWQSSIVLGLLGSFTLVPFPFIALSLAIKRPILKRIQYILLSIGVVAALLLIAWLVNPELFVSYIKTFQGSSSALYDKSGALTPTPFLMFGVLLNQTNGISVPLVLVSLIYFCLVIGASWYVIKKNQEDPLKVYSLAMFAIFMVLPRIKPYYFIFLVIPLYFLFRDCSDKIKILMFAVISLGPVFMWYYPFILRYYHVIFRTGSLPFLIYEYAQTISLFLIFIIAFALEYYKPVSAPSSQT
jgi:hypothetical protein